ncbi:MAG: polyhydroxyalkanoate depolymerase [Pseudomonadota bacterium]
MTVLYHAYEFTHAAISPMRQAARIGRQALQSPFNPFSGTISARATAATLEMFVSATKRYGKPEFGIETAKVGNRELPIIEEIILEKPFANLVHFRRVGAEERDDPKVLIVAPMSGHYATLLRGTVAAMLPEHDVYITDWIDAREVPVSEGHFDLADYADYLMDFCQELATNGDRPALMAVCQPGVPSLAAASLMAEDEDPGRPSALILMGSPIDTRVNMTDPCKLAASRSLGWFEKNVVVTVPWPNRGFLRRVYPGFLQLSGFMSMNMDRHVDAHYQHYQNLIRGDGDSVDAHNRFYDEYMSVMDLTAEFYLQTVERVFQQHHFPLGKYMHRDRLVDPKAITDIGLMTVEGEKDDITGRGQTEAAQGLCLNIPSAARVHYVQEEVGHYGVFNGSRFRKHIQPKIRDFIRQRREALAN